MRAEKACAEITRGNQMIAMLTCTQDINNEGGSGVTYRILVPISQVNKQSHAGVAVPHASTISTHVDTFNGQGKRN